MAPAVVVYDIPHWTSWGLRVVLYLMAKGVSAGVVLLSLSLSWASPGSDAPLLRLAPGLSLVFLGLTLALVLTDLRQPQRFLYILLRPNLHSWLSWGAYLLLLYGALNLLWLVWGGTGWLGLALLPTALMAAIYTSFLFSQAKGREMWQGWLVPWELLSQALVLGAGALIGAELLLGASPEPLNLLRWGLLFCLLFHIIALSPRLATPRGAGSRWTVAATLGIGGLLPLLLLALAGANPGALGMAAFLAGVGVFAWEYQWVYGAQRVAPD